MVLRRLVDLHLHSSYSDGEATILEMVEAALQKDLSTIAFTDHTDIEGNFIYAKKFQGSFSDYCAEIMDARDTFPDLDIWCGIEVTQDFSEIPADAVSIFSQCRIILIDGYAVANPVLCAKAVFDRCQDAEFLGTMVGIAHPRFETFTDQDLEVLVHNPIFLELNNAKINKAQIRGIEDLLSYPGARANRWSVGSDAHEIHLVGDVAVAWEILRKFDLESRLIV